MSDKFSQGYLNDMGHVQGTLRALARCSKVWEPSQKVEDSIVIGSRGCVRRRPTLLFQL